MIKKFIIIGTIILAFGSCAPLDYTYRYYDVLVLETRPCDRGVIVVTKRGEFFAPRKYRIEPGRRYMFDFDSKHKLRNIYPHETKSRKKGASNAQDRHR